MTTEPSQADANTRPLRIAMISLYLPSESKIGVGWTVHRLANELIKSGHQVTVYSPCSRPADARYEVVHMPQRGKLRTFKWGWALRTVDFSSFDVLHAHTDDHFIRKAHRPSVHVRTLHGSCFDEALNIRKLKERLRMLIIGVTEVVSAIRTPTVVGVSRASIRMYPWCTTVIPNGVDSERFARASLKEDDPTILFVGTFRNRKRGRLVMQVFEQTVLPAVPDAKLWMVCDDAPPARNVFVLGRLSDDQLVRCYQRAWVFTLPSTYEGFGIPYIEALAAGLPIVSTPNAGARELLAGVEGCELVGDAELGDAIIRNLQSAATYSHVRASKYDWRVVVAEYERVYRPEPLSGGAFRG